MNKNELAVGSISCRLSIIEIHRLGESFFQNTYGCVFGPFQDLLKPFLLGAGEIAEYVFGKVLAGLVTFNSNAKSRHFCTAQTPEY